MIYIIVVIVIIVNLNEIFYHYMPCKKQGDYSALLSLVQNWWLAPKSLRIGLNIRLETPHG